MLKIDSAIGTRGRAIDEEITLIYCKIGDHRNNDFEQNVTNKSCCIWQTVKTCRKKSSKNPDSGNRIPDFGFPDFLNAKFKYLFWLETGFINVIFTKKRLLQEINGGSQNYRILLKFSLVSNYDLTASYLVFKNQTNLQYLFLWSVFRDFWSFWHQKLCEDEAMALKPQNFWLKIGEY